MHSNLFTDVDVLATQYHNVVSIHTPIITHIVTSHPPMLWYIPEIALARHWLERRWRQAN